MVMTGAIAAIIANIARVTPGDREKARGQQNGQHPSHGRNLVWGELHGGTALGHPLPTRPTPLDVPRGVEH